LSDYLLLYEEFAEFYFACRGCLHNSSKGVRRTARVRSRAPT
jgi:hypothetical protein